jgi:hypothetical protein
MCLSLRAKEEISVALAKLAKSLHEATADGLIRVYLGRDRETNKHKHHNRKSRGPMREAQDTCPSMLSMEASVPSARTWNFRHSVAFPNRDEQSAVQPVQRCGAKTLASSSDLTFAEG